MLTKVKLFLLLFGCLFRLQFNLFGMCNAATCMGTLGKFSEASKRSDFIRHPKNISSLGKPNEGTTWTSDRENNLFNGGQKGVRASSKVKKLSLKKALFRVILKKRLKQELLKRQMIVPGYYEAECSEKKPCKEGTYCNVLYCEKCHKLNVACTNNEQCCKGFVCTFGRCEKTSKGDPGTFCEKDGDCKEACCVLEPTINSHLPICKPMLEEYHQCAAILYRKIWIGEKPDCGPCKPGLECAQKGVCGSHEVCMKPQ